MSTRPRRWRSGRGSRQGSRARARRRRRSRRSGRSMRRSRPEGKNGPLVRTIASHKAYYERWAKTWEFQALLKARPLAGDRALGREYVEMNQPFVWGAVTRQHFVEDSQAMRRRVESHVPCRRGGSADQARGRWPPRRRVHGPAPPAGPRAGRRVDSQPQHPDRVGSARRRWLRRSVARRTARRLLPADARARAPHPAAPAAPDAPDAHRGAGPARLARAVACAPTAPTGSSTAGRRQARRPSPPRGALLPPAPPGGRTLSAEETSLSPDEARARLAAIGYLDPSGAMRRIAALTEGLSRRAAVSASCCR